MAFVATLATGVGLTVSAFHGMSGIDRELQLAAVSQQQQRVQPNFVDHHPPRCGAQREHARRI
jgi:hypothetical protein